MKHHNIYDGYFTGFNVYANVPDYVQKVKYGPYVTGGWRSGVKKIGDGARYYILLNTYKDKIFCLE